MIPRVLIADANQALLKATQQTLDRYREIFALHTAATGADAALALNDDPFSLLIADASTAMANGPLLVDYVARRYPLLPVIVTGRPESLASCAPDVGTRYLACLRKPFNVDRLAERILVAIDWEADGGTLQDVSTFIVPQMIEMEKKTCTVKVTKVLSARHGILFFFHGDLVDALCEGRTGAAAACKIFSWDKVRMAIHNSCSSVERRIHSPVSAILLEAMRLRDEAQENEPEEDSESPAAFTPESQATNQGQGHKSRPDLAAGADRFISTLGNTKGVEDIYRDSSWNYLLNLADQVGSALGIGTPKVAFISHEQQGSCLVLVPGKETTVIAIEKHSFKEEIMEAILLMMRRDEVAHSGGKGERAS